MKKPQISIIGGGIAGLTTAIALQQKGFLPTVFEAAPQIKPVGAGLVLAANAMQVYQHLGIADDIISQGYHVPHFSIYDQNKQKIGKIDAQKVAETYGIHNFAIHRGSLHSVLLHHLQNIPLHVNKSAISITQNTDNVVINFADGSQHTTDFLIVADGIHSHIRQQLLPQAQIRYAGYTCWRGIVDNSVMQLSETSETWGSEGRFGIVPLGNQQIYWFACLNAPANSNTMRRMTVNDLAAIFGKYHDPIPHVLAHTPNENILWNDIIDLQPIQQYAFQKVLLIGDAAHATTPNMGQGACQAIEDAYFLGEILGNTSDIPLAFKLFEQKRIPKTHWIVHTSWRMGQIAQWQNPLAISLRNLLFRLIPESIHAQQLQKVLTL